MSFMFRYILPKNEAGDYILKYAGWGGLVLRIPLTVNYRSPYNKAMTKDLRENRLKARIRDIADFYHQKAGCRVFLK